MGIDERCSNGYFRGMERTTFFLEWASRSVNLFLHVRTTPQQGLKASDQRMMWCPANAQAAWVDAFIKTLARQNKIPVDSFHSRRYA